MLFVQVKFVVQFFASSGPRHPSCSSYTVFIGAPTPRLERGGWFEMKENMNCFVTGASGFIGANLVHELAARGHKVKALLRPGSDERGLRGASFDIVRGDVS